MMMDLHEKAEKLARLNETRTQGRPHAPLMTITEPEPLGVETAHTLRALSTRLAEVEREMDAARADLSDALQRSCDNLERAVAAEDALDEARARVAAAYEEAANEAASVRWAEDTCGRTAAMAEQAIRALARPEETDALDRIRAKERERYAKIADSHHDPEETSGTEDFDAGYDAAAKAIAAAIREDKT